LQKCRAFWYYLLKKLLERTAEEGDVCRLALGHDARRAEIDDGQRVKKGRVRREHQHGRLLRRRLPSFHPHPVETTKHHKRANHLTDCRPQPPVEHTKFSFALHNSGLIITHISEFRDCFGGGCFQRSEF
jgi:hypothetical protein